MGRSQVRRKTRWNARPEEMWREFRRILPCPPALSYILQSTTGTDSDPMNAPSELSFEEMLRIRLEVLRREHRDLDQAILALEETGRPDQLTLRRLKKQKLSLKDQIVKIEDQLIPDIIA
jgi:hypothetical protein